MKSSIASKTYKGYKDFSRSIFREEASFQKAIFEDKANFAATAFEQPADFSEAIFNEEVYFTFAKFRDNVTFDKAIFKKNVYFTKARFHRLGSFESAIFEGNVYFIDAAFRADTKFTLASFKVADYSRAIFNGEVSFEYARFADSATFTDVSFLQFADFDYAVFDGPVYFGYGRFADKASMYMAVFGGLAVFAAKPNCPLFSPSHETALTSIRFKQPEQVYFDSINFSKVRLIRTDLRKVVFTRVTWAQKYGRYILYDELGMIDKENREEYRLIEKVYTQLKKHWEEEGNFEVAGSFHYGEKEMRRRCRAVWEDPLLWFYWLLSGYGEDASRSIMNIILIWLAFSFFYFGCCFQSSPTLLDSVYGSMKQSLQIMTLQKDPATLPESIQALMGPLQIGLAALAIRRRMSR